jgi:hypothetical protein
MSESKIPYDRMQVIVEVLSRLGLEASMPNITTEEYGKRCFAITRILREVDKEWGKKAMLHIILETKKRIGHMPPLDGTIVRDLVQLGCVVQKISKVLQYNLK